METEYIIGVDGGGTKTDYLIFTTAGEFVDSYRVSSRSHEFLSGGFAEVEETVLADIEYLLKKNNIIKPMIAAAAFGMAGIDTPAQLSQMKRIIDKANLRTYTIANDSILGIKAGCASGVGICSINGTGTVASGIDEHGNILQVGGIGMATGDNAGGLYIATCAVRAVYDYYFRCGAPTLLTAKLMSYWGLDDPNELINVISEKFYEDREKDKDIITFFFEAVNSEDAVAVGIVQDIAEQLAKSVSGCIRNLHFTGTPEIILAGSIWTKVDCPLLINHFKKCIYLHTGMQVNPLPLQVIPAAGAIIWALELACNHPATAQQRNAIMRSMPK
jgi:N-acetylglucosamine kinase-like BadF-type ATPase